MRPNEDIWSHEHNVTWTQATVQALAGVLPLGGGPCASITTTPQIVCSTVCPTVGLCQR